MRVLIDSNVILDALQNRKPFNNCAKEVIRCASNNVYDACLVSSCITDIYYIHHKYTHDNKKTKEAISILLEIFDVIDTNKNDVINALNSNISDYEDAVLVESAYRNKVDVIVTKNKKDFKNSKVKAVTPEELLKSL